MGSTFSAGNAKRSELFSSVDAVYSNKKLTILKIQPEGYIKQEGKDTTETNQAEVCRRAVVLQPSFPSD